MIRDSSAMKGHGGFDLETSFGYSGLRDFAEPSQYTGSGDHWFCVLRNWFAPCLQWVWMVWYDMLSYMILFDMWYVIIWYDMTFGVHDAWHPPSFPHGLMNDIKSKIWTMKLRKCNSIVNESLFYSGWFVAHRFEAAMANGLRTLNAVFDLNLQAPAFFASCGMFTALSSWNRHCFFNCSWFMIHS